MRVALSLMTNGPQGGPSVVYGGGSTEREGDTLSGPSPPLAPLVGLQPSGGRCLPHHPLAGPLTGGALACPPLLYQRRAGRVVGDGPTIRDVVLRGHTQGGIGSTPPRS